jgi:pyridoxal 5'-phosphate synthase pdxT subunit
MKIGILSLQGSFHEHIVALKKLNIETTQIKLPEQLNDIDALIIPGGESTTILQLLEKYNFNLQEFNKPILGTCAGCIILAELGLIDIKVKRNAYGSQIYSFIDEILIGEKKIKGVFIRAPKILEIGNNVEILAKHNDIPVLVKENKILAATFHPELSNDLDIYELFFNFNL